MINEGNYNYLSESITSDNFPSNEEGVIEVLTYLVSFVSYINTQNSIARMSSMNPPLRPATLKELLAFGISKPDLPQNYKITALWSNWRDLYGYMYVPCISGDEWGRYLFLNWWRYGWYQNWQFLSVSM